MTIRLTKRIDFNGQIVEKSVEIDVKCDGLDWLETLKASIPILRKALDRDAPEPTT